MRDIGSELRSIDQQSVSTPDPIFEAWQTTTVPRERNPQTLSRGKAEGKSMVGQEFTDSEVGVKLKKRIAPGITLIQRTSGKRVFEVVVTRTVAGHKRFRRSRDARTLPEAHALKRQLEDQLDKEFRLDAIPSFGKWFEGWIRSAKTVRRNSTLSSYERTILKHVPTSLWNKCLVEVNQADIRSVVLNESAKISPKTRQNLLQCLRVLFRDAIRSRLITFNPCEGITIKVPEVELEAWTLSEASYVLAKAAEGRNKWFCHWVLAIFTGMRNGELYALKWRNVDFENRRIYVSENWTSLDGFHSTKSRMNRVVPISPLLLGFLLQLNRYRGHHEFVLPHYNEWTKGNQARLLRSFADSVGVKQINFHALRATFITICLLQGIEIPRVQRIVGHSRLDTTMRYVRLVASDLDGTLDKFGIDLPRLYAGNVPPPKDLPLFVPKAETIVMPDVELAEIFRDQEPTQSPLGQTPS